MRSLKARNLFRLSQVAAVPPFRVVERGESTKALDLGFAAARYLVRACTADEDGATQSRAGSSFTSAPVAQGKLPTELRRAFSAADVVECIVQEHVRGISGVAFCPEGDAAHVEYSAVSGGVTAGRVNPFAAILPSNLPRYRALGTSVARIRDAMGAGELEFVRLDTPCFVQWRPITATFTYDTEVARLKMALQEEACAAWEVTEFGVDVQERMEWSAEIVELFARAVPRAYAEATGRAPRLPPRCFFRIGRQMFSPVQLRDALRLRWGQLLRLGFRAPRLLAWIRRELGPTPCQDPVRLLELSTLANLLSETIGRCAPGLRRELFHLRERSLETLLSVLPPRELLVTLPFSRRLGARIERDDSRACWRAFAPADGAGFTVVPGDIDQGPFFRYARDSRAVPSGVVLLTDELYPELGAILDRVRGIIAEGGAFGSHVAILARERNLPLRIQAAGACERFGRSL